MVPTSVLVALLLAAAPAPPAAAPPAAPASPALVALPGGEGGIGLDDLAWSEALRAVVVPAGRTGQVDLVDPATRAVTAIPGFARSASPARGHGQGPTSADTGDGLLFAIDRTLSIVAVVDPRARRIVARAALGGSPDYVRWVGPAREVWVTEPDQERIEVFRLRTRPAPRLARVGTVSIPGGPESLVVEPSGRRAYTNTFGGASVAVDVATHAVAARWDNGCRGARGLALDRDRFLLVGCAEGRAVALDLARDGAAAGEARTGAGVDGIAFAPRLAHLYVPGAERGEVTVLGVGEDGAMKPLGTLPSTHGGHCAATDDAGQAFVCDPLHGVLLVLRDPWPASR